MKCIEQFTLTIWNPTIQPIEHMIRVPVTKKYSIRSPTGAIIAADVRIYTEYLFYLKYFQLIPISESTKNIPGRTSSAQYELLFRTPIPALGFNTYYFEAKSKE
jgi:hypothetical protein